MTPADVDDPNLLAAVEHALAPLSGLLSPADLEIIRNLLREELTMHPVSARLLRQLAPPPQVQQSGERGLEAADERCADGAERRARSRGSR